MDQLADLFLKAIRALSVPDSPKLEALEVISQVIAAHMPLPDSVLTQVLSAISLVLKKEKSAQISDAAMDCMSQMILSCSGVSNLIMTAGKIQPWLAITLEALISLVKTGVSDRRKRAWNLLVQLTQTITDPQALFNCFPGLFRAAVGEVRSNKNQLLGCSIHSLIRALELVLHLTKTVLFDGIEGVNLDDIIENVKEGLESLLESLETCLENPINALNSELIQKVGSLIKTVVEYCGKLTELAKGRITLFLVGFRTIENCPVPPINFPLCIQIKLSSLLQSALESISTASNTFEKDDFPKVISMWKLLQTDQPFFLSSNLRLITMVLIKICPFRIPKVAAFPLNEESIADFNAFPEALRHYQTEMFDSMQKHSILSLEILDLLRKHISRYSENRLKSEFVSIHELAMCVLRLKIESGFPLLMDFLKISGPETLPATEQDLYHTFLQLILLSLLPSVQLSPLEFLQTILQLWSEATDAIIDQKLLDFAHSETADLNVFLDNYAEKVLLFLNSMISGGLPDTRILSCYLKLFGVKRLFPLTKTLLKTLDFRINRLKVNAVVGVIRGFEQVMKYYKPAIDTGVLSNGNLGREILLRLKPLLAWKREKGRNSLVFQVLKLFLTLVPVMDTLPLTVENESAEPFSIHEEGNVVIPKALPVLVHEYYPSLVTLSKALSRSQDYSCLGKVYQLLLETEKRNPGFMTKRLGDIVEVLKDTLSTGPASTTFKLSAQRLCLELLAQVDQRKVKESGLESYQSKFRSEL